MYLNILGKIMAALSGVGHLLKGFRPKVKFRAPTEERKKRNRRSADARVHMEKTFRSYAVRYTNMLSRRQASNRLIEESARAFNRGDKRRGELYLDMAATFPW